MTTTEMKLTAITLSARGKKVQAFLPLLYINGRAILPTEQFNNLCDDMGVKRGDTVDVG